MFCVENTQVAEVIQEPGEPVRAGFIEMLNNVGSYTKFFVGLYTMHKSRTLDFNFGKGMVKWK